MLVAWKALAPMMAGNAQETRRALDLSEANVLLLAQQSDVVFGELSESFFSGSELPESNRRLLETWMQFDGQFLIQNAANQSLKLERAAAHQRVGHALFLLGESGQAVGEFRQAVTLLEELSRDHPKITRYGLETAGAYGRLGAALKAAGQPAEAAGAYREALRLLNDPRLPPDPERERSAAELNRQLSPAANE
jgi:tetratricopeptide (TPR) repeat protein